MREFHATDPYLFSFFLSTYIPGYAIGPLFISPLSEVFGRAPLYHLCNTLFTICTVLCGRTSSLWSLAIARFFAGVGGSSVFALAPSLIADMFRKEKRGAIMALVVVGYNLGPSVSPTAVSYINAAWGWRWVFYISGGAGLVVTVLNYIGLSETYAPVLKTARLRKQRRVQGLSMRSTYDLDDGASTTRLSGRAMLMPLRMLFFSRTFFLTSFLTAVAYGSMYTLYSTIPTTFLEIYAWPPKKFDLAYLSTVVGTLLSMIACAGISDTIVKRMKRNDDNRPENRLLPMCFFWPLVSAGLFVYAWTAHYKIHWAVPLFGASVFGARAMSSMVSTAI
jgi:multidrug resistance protein